MMTWCYLDGMASATDSNPYKCQHCDKAFAHSQSLSKHKAKHHADEKVCRISCVACDGTFSEAENYRQHCQSAHKSDGQSFDKVTADFPSLQSFEEWKASEEKVTHVSFRNQRTYKHTDGLRVTTYYLCNCSGRGRKEPEVRKRSSSSIRIGGRCPAFMTVTTSNGATMVCVEACLSHLGHEQRLGNVRIPDSLRISIAAEIARGVSFDAILDQIRSHVDGAFDRSHIIERKDLNNIKQQFRISKARLHVNDYESILVRNYPVNFLIALCNVFTSVA